MKTLFIEAHYNKKIILPKEIVSKLPKKIGLVATTQFTNQLNDIKAQLEKQGKEAFIEKGFQINPGQVLGCDVSSAKKLEEKVDAFLYIGDGLFHPRGIGLEIEKDVFLYDPVSSAMKLLDRKEMDLYKKRKKGAMLKFHASNIIGAILSTKPGQASFNIMKKLKEKYPDTHFYCFVSETLNFNELENFPFIEAWVNTACPRIDEDLIVVNHMEIL